MKTNKQARNKYTRLSEKEKDIKKEYRRNRYKNMSQENNQRLKEYQKNYCRAKKRYKSFCLFFFTRYKMEQKVLTFGEEYTINNKLHMHKKTISIDKEGIKRIVLSKKDSYGNKGAFIYFIGYVHKDNALPSSLCIILPHERICKIF